MKIEYRPTHGIERVVCNNSEHGRVAILHWSKMHKRIHTDLLILMAELLQRHYVPRRIQIQVVSPSLRPQLSNSQD